MPAFRSRPAPITCPAPDSPPAVASPAEGSSNREADHATVSSDAFAQIREKSNEIVAAVIRRAIDDGSYQHAKWLFEFAGIRPAGHSSPEDEPSLLRLFLDQLQIPESSEDLAAEFSANERAVE